ncbi:heparin lyase I family protein [Streptomyces sp. NBC_01435]|uniref:heparin lyase I family protein n=1 Tax=Streptomyces sp. NBC_01435 TaxID=2903865 RepID=UPI002E31B08A|nr:heparin lyase I family protein [Streptomyces sp. NBC_01435]
MHRKTMARASAALALAGALGVVGLNAADAGQDRPDRSTAQQPRSSVRPALLDIDYKDGSLDSGIPGLTTTHATAHDASSVVRSGDDYAITHKVTLGDSGYESDGAPRSESATNDIPEGVFHVGDARRYEFSVLLKDWKTYEPGDSESGDIIFQGKHAGGNRPSCYLMTKRNSIAFRSPALNLQAEVVDDFRPYIDRWMTFRVDVRWTDDKTGYYRISTRMPGEPGFTLRKTYENVRTFHPVNPTNFGYIKWGLYRPSQSIENGDVPTRIVRHDSISIQDLAGG